jgi:hypothetical protein
MWRIEEKANQNGDSWRHQLFGINESGISGGENSESQRQQAKWLAMAKA